MFDSIKLSDLPKAHCGILRQPSSTRPTVWVVEKNGMRAVVKDFSTSKFLLRNTVGRFLIWRESKAYRKLMNLSGVPVLHRVIDGLALVLEEIPGGMIDKYTKEMGIPDSFFHALKHLVGECHKRGIAHCDLKKASNILLGDDGHPYIVDWGAAIFEREFRFFPLNLIYRRFMLDDHMAIIKLKLRLSPETVALEEREHYNRRSAAERLIRVVRERLRDILQKIA